MENIISRTSSNCSDGPRTWDWLLVVPLLLALSPPTTATLMLGSGTIPQSIRKKFAISYGNHAHRQEPLAAHPSTVATSIVKTRANKNNKVCMNKKSKAIVQLLLGHKGTNPNDTPILIPGELDLSLEDLLQETPCNAFHNLLMLFHTKIETKKNTSQCT